ncbi:MAG: hypothetical protein KC414_13035, partial [Romboutsia sp.]|nr:hypothetical protein [Romboutsia sp.]
MKIGLDIDGVLADFGTHFLDYLNIEDKSPAKEWDDDRFVSNFHRIMDDENFWLTIPRLIEPYSLKFKPVIYVTARSIPSEITKKWLLNNGFPDVPLISVGYNENKIDSLKDTIDVFIDDAVHNFEELNNAGIECLLMTRSHNLDYDAGDK